MMLSIISNLICPAIALSMGILSYRNLNEFWRLLFFQIVAYGITLIISYALTAYQKSQGQDENTQIVYNAFMLIEMLILITAAHVYFNVVWSKHLAFFAYGLFLMVFLLQISYNGIHTFANYASAAQSTILTLFYGAIVYQYFFFHPAPLGRSPEIWMCVGLLAFLAGCIPYITMINYMQKTYPRENIILYGTIINILSIVRYLLLAFGFFLVHRNTLALKTKTYE